MENPYELHSWSKQYREEILRGARGRDLVRSVRLSGRAYPSGLRAVAGWSRLLALLARRRVVE